MKFPFWEIQAATSDFSKENLLGEGEFGHVYKGQLKDGHVIAARLRKEASSQSQGYTEFFYEVHCVGKRVGYASITTAYTQDTCE